MRLKTALFLIFLIVLGIILSSYFVGGVLLSQVIDPFTTIDIGGTTDTPEVVTHSFSSQSNLSFVDAELFQGWIPWIIKQVSILIGALSLLVFGYAGVTLIVYGDNEEQLGKSTKMIIFGIVGIALAAFSYTIIANVLVLF